MTLVIYSILKRIIKLLVPTRFRIYLMLYLTRRYRYWWSYITFYLNSYHHFRGLYDKLDRHKNIRKKILGGKVAGEVIPSKILFSGFEILKDRSIGFSDVFLYSLAYYLKGKDLGYDEIHIVFPRFVYESRWEVPEESWYWQKTAYMPWKYYPRNKEIDVKEWDLVFDTTKKNSLYGGFPGLAETGRYVYQYSDIYYKEKGILPLLNKERKNDGKPYLLFQYREFYMSHKGKERVTSLRDLEHVYNVVKGYLGDKYEYWKIGEPCSMDGKFDKVVPMMYHDLDGFVKIIGDCSLLVGSHSGVRGIAFHIPNLPIIEICMLPEHNPRNKEVWRAEVGKSIVEQHPSWCDDRLLSFDIGTLPSKGEILKFLERQFEEL